jgi:hypothetical protein
VEELFLKKTGRNGIFWDEKEPQLLGRNLWGRRRVRWRWD